MRGSRGGESVREHQTTETRADLKQLIPCSDTPEMWWSSTSNGICWKRCGARVCCRRGVRGASASGAAGAGAVPSPCVEDRMQGAGKGETGGGGIEGRRRGQEKGIFGYFGVAVRIEGCAKARRVHRERRIAAHRVAPRTEALQPAFCSCAAAQIGGGPRRVTRPLRSLLPHVICTPPCPACAHSPLCPLCCLPLLPISSCP